MRRCVWCRSKLGEGELSISHRVAGDARLAHSKYQIEMQGKADALTGYIEVCGECAVAVRKAVLGAYLERRKSAPENVEQVEALEAQTADLEKRRAEAEAARIEAEAESKRLREQLAETKHRLKASAAILTKQLELAEDSERPEEVEGELEPEPGNPRFNPSGANPWKVPYGG